LGRKDIFSTITYSNPEYPLEGGSAWRTYGLAIDSDRNIYVVAYYSIQGFYAGIQVFYPNGTFWKTLADGTLEGAKGLVVDDSTRDVYVALSDADTVNIIFNNGTMITTTYGQHYWDFPAGIAFHQASRTLYVADGDYSYSTNRIQVYDASK
jgi:DNA-binding beta-propeller fold protein YncE